MSAIDRLRGLVSTVAIKAPVRCATTAAITLNGLQTVDNIAVAAGDRVLVKNQVDQTTNGIYVADTGNWTRDVDFNGVGDCVQGTLVVVVSGGQNGAAVFQQNAANPVIGTSVLTFVPAGGALFNFVGGINVKDFGAKLDWNGTTGTDDSAAINAACSAAQASGGGYVIVPGAAFVASTVVVPSAVTLAGVVFVPGNPVLGSRIVGSTVLSPVVQIGSGGNNNTGGLKSISVTRAAGVPGSTVIGILIQDGYNVVLEDCLSDNHGLGYRFKSTPAIGMGISAKVINGFTSRIVDAHIENDSWAELYWIGGRIGQNGNTDYSSNTFVRAKGGVAATAGGPNGIIFDSVQFNCGGTAAVKHFWEFVSLGAGGIPGIDATVFKIANCHVEGVSGAGSAIFFSDSTWNAISRLEIMDTMFNCPSTPMWALNAATQPDDWDLVGNKYFTSTFNLAPTLPFNSVSIVGGRISGTMSLTGAAGSTMSIHGLRHSASFTLAGNWATFTSVGEHFLGGSFINNATGQVAVLNLTGLSIDVGSSAGPGDFTLKNIGANGAVIKLTDSVASIFIRAFSGALEVVNAAFNLTAFKVTPTGEVTAIRWVKTGVVTVATLPAAATVGGGVRFFVSDATQTHTAGIGAIVAGGGTNFVPVVSDSANWRIG